METLLTEKQLAEKTGISVRTIQQWRYDGSDHAPPYIKIGACVRYKQSEIEEWIDSNRYESTTQADHDGGTA